PMPRAKGALEGLVNEVDADHVKVLLRRHLNDFPVDEFHSLIAEEAYVSHAVILFARPATPFGLRQLFCEFLDRHALAPPRGSFMSPLPDLISQSQHCSTLNGLSPL